MKMSDLRVLRTRQQLNSGIRPKGICVGCDWATKRFLLICLVQEISVQICFFLHTSMRFWPGLVATDVLDKMSQSRGRVGNRKQTALIVISILYFFLLGLFVLHDVTNHLRMRVAVGIGFPSFCFKHGHSPFIGHGVASCIHGVASCNTRHIQPQTHTQQARICAHVLICSRATLHFFESCCQSA